MAAPLTSVSDVSWVRNAFLVSAKDLSDVDKQNRFYTTASLKYTDTTPGGNFAINPPPQFTSFADPKAPSRKSGGKGMGIYYSEAIDDHSQVIHMRFGVPQFNSLTQFFTHFYSSGAGMVARTGRSTDAVYNIGRAAGFVVSVMSWKLLGLLALGVGLRFLQNKPSSKFYYLKPAMPVYWQVVQTIVNQIAVNKGVIPRAGEAVADATVNMTIADNYAFDQTGNSRLHDLLPDIFFEKGGIDVYALATRAKRLQRKQHQNEMQVLGDSSVNLSSAIGSLFSPQNKLTDDKRPNFPDYLKTWLKTSNSKPSDSTSTSDSGSEALDTTPVGNSGLFEFFKAELDDGSAFVSFRVDTTGPVAESFSNQTGDSPLASKINTMSSQSRETRFDMANGNLSDGLIGKTLGAIVGTAADVVSGIADGLGISGIASLGGSAFVDIPKHWTSASAELGRSTYSVQLRSPYGNPVSQLMNLYLPLAMLLAGALPLATGPQSYTSPFLCELYDRGRRQVRLGIIDSLQVTRGVGNLGFDDQGNAMGSDVTFSVLDLSNLIYLPISQGLTNASAQALGDLGFEVGAAVGGVAGGVAGSAAGPVGTVGGAAGGAAIGGTAGAAVLGAGGAVVDTINNVQDTLNGLFDGDNPFADYMAVLGGMGLADQIYMMRRFKLNLTMQMAQWRSWLTPAHFASMAGDLLPSRMVGMFFKGTNKT
ncbi:hypothetical protein AWB81_01824 [Caballeronia arationis]|uniref:hypothetical protein n=1 Tax=Caballeronia arationis TaxID=1777142 RepID=UPI00074C4C3D|nr:hypothetical protein [Caballeronia arationis]SAK59314.1 hypothetical protein AWB81_01824 [Caballeronia arationis]